MRKLFLGVAGSLASICMQAQDSLKSVTLDEVVVTGTRYEVSVEKSTKSITRISQEDLTSYQGARIPDVLNSIPNLQIDGVYGSPGTNLGYFARGGRNRQTTILVDGIPMLDASGISPEFDLRLIPLGQVEDIEVMRGGLSTLYGSGASAAVINIRLKMPEPGTHGAAELNAGSYGTFSQSLALTSSGKKIYGLVMFDNSTSDGFSSAYDSTMQNDFDKDGMWRKNALIRLGIKPSEKLDIAIFSGWDQFAADYDDGPFADANNLQRSEQFRIGLQGTMHQKLGKVVLTGQHSWLDKEFESSFPDAYKSITSSLEITESVRLSKIATLLGGISYQQLAYSQEFVDKDTVNFSIVDPYLSVVFDFPFDAVFQGGLRLNHHSEYGSNLVYDAGLAYRMRITKESSAKIHGSLSTSYITPSLFQLFSYFGNNSLNPEEAINWEVGGSFYRNNLTVSLVRFSRTEKSLIDFISYYDDMGFFDGGSYYNRPGSREVHGYEVELALRSEVGLFMKGGYSYSTTSNLQTFYRIPMNKANLLLGFRWKTGAANIRYDFTGSRKDINYATFKEVKLNSFHLVGLSVSENFLKQRLTAYASCNNLFDANYQWAPGYSSIGRNLTMGIRYAF